MSNQHLQHLDDFKEFVLHSIRTIKERSFFRSVRILVFAIVLPLWPNAAGATANITTVESGFDRPGSAFLSEATKNVDACRALCFEHAATDLPVEKKCRSYTFIISTSVCSLKNSAPAPVPNGDAISGIHVIVKFGDNGVNYPGHNIPGRDFESWNPEECQDTCRGEKACRAWTWMKPGSEGPAGRCYLKSEVPSGKRDNCCVSGWGLSSP